MTPGDSFNENKSWREKVIKADEVWAQIKVLLDKNGVALPATPRRPDVRLIVENVSGSDIQFLNPGDHSGTKQEAIPGTGDKKAVMVMVRGATLDEQYKNAKTLYETYDLGVKGMSEEFMKALRSGKLSALIDEAYGPAPFKDQSEKLVDVAWAISDTLCATIRPQKGAAASYGARAATNETVFLAKFDIYVQGTATTSELVESDGMCIAISSGWKIKAETTRPIVPSVAQVYYGAHFGGMPAVKVGLDGTVEKIDLKNGTVITPYDDAKKPPAASVKGKNTFAP
jgi:hypothetical protein